MNGPGSQNPRSSGSEGNFIDTPVFGLQCLYSVVSRCMPAGTPMSKENTCVLKYGERVYYAFPRNANMMT